MPIFENQTPEFILERVLSRMDTNLQTREGSYAYEQAAPLALELWRMMMTLDELVEAFYVTPDSGPYLDAHARLLGLSRRMGTKAAAVIRFTGNSGTVIPAGTAFFTQSGLGFTLEEEVTLRDGGGTGLLTADELGARYNVGPGEVDRLLRTIPGLEGYVNEAAAGGTDPEDDADLFARIDERRKEPATSGNEAHYRQWALSVDGIGAARVDRLWAGPGTVRVLVVGYDRRPVDTALVEACARYIETQRPIGAQVTVATAASAPVDVMARVSLESSANPVLVRDAFRKLLDTYLQSLSFAEYTVYANRIGALLMSIEGVVDYSDLTLNGEAGNLTIHPDAVPLAGEVELI